MGGAQTASASRQARMRAAIPAALGLPASMARAMAKAVSLMSVGMRRWDA